MCCWCSQITSDYTDCPLNPSRLVLPLPPFSSSHYSHSLSLITVLVAQHMVYRGVSTQLPLINYWHFNFAINPFCPSFSSLLFSRTFFAIPLAEKMHPLFSANYQSTIFFSRFLLCYNFCSSLMYMPITYIEGIETTLLTLFGRILGFIEGKGR